LASNAAKFLSKKRRVFDLLFRNSGVGFILKGSRKKDKGGYRLSVEEERRLLSGC
jgi:hypothetical protein